MPERYEFPGERSFAFTILDDTDVATADNIRPVYRLLDRLGMRITKTVWPVACPEANGRRFSGSETMEDPEYLDVVMEIHRNGFEMGWHCATMHSSRRERTVIAMEKFHEHFGYFPRVHANHSSNRENLYSGADRLDDPILRGLYRLITRESEGYYLGHVAGSPFWWGDLCQKHIQYVRNLTFREINLAKINPSLPYRDPRRPLAPLWFSATEADDADEFVRLLQPESLDRLEREGGFCLLATHLGKRYAEGGDVRASVRERFEDLAGRNGWFPTVGELLDWLRARRPDLTLPASEWRKMQWRWARERFLGSRRKRRDWQRAFKVELSDRAASRELVER